MTSTSPAPAAALNAAATGDPRRWPTPDVTGHAQHMMAW